MLASAYTQFEYMMKWMTECMETNTHRRASANNEFIINRQKIIVYVFLGFNSAFSRQMEKDGVINDLINRLPFLMARFFCQ